MLSEILKSYLKKVTANAILQSLEVLSHEGSSVENTLQYSKRKQTRSVTLAACTCYAP